MPAPELKSWRATVTEDGVKLALVFTGLESAEDARFLKDRLVDQARGHRRKGQKALVEEE